jgi:putative MATE family efflux protein
MEAKTNVKNNLIEGNIRSSLIKFAIPFLLANLLQALYGGADLIIAGKFADSASVSAVATGSQVMQTITGIITGLTTGGTVLIAQYIGAKKKKDIGEGIGTMISMFIIIAVVLTLIMLIFTNKITLIMQTPIEALEYTKEYIFICSCGIIFIVGYNAVSGILRGMGDSRTPLVFIAVACIINIILGVIFVGIFNMGAKGTALATVIAQCVSLILAVIIMKKKDLGFKLTKSNIVINKDKAANILKLGMPIAVQDALVNVSFLMITAIINTMGLTASAAVGVVEKLIVFMMLPPSAFSAAIATMSAQNIGAKKYDRAKKGLNIGIVFSLIFGLLCFVYSQFRGDTLISIFTNDIEVIKAGELYLKSYTIDCIMVCFIFCMNGFFNGAGHSLFCMGHSLIATFLFRIPIAYFLSKISTVTLYEIGLAAPISSIVSVIICFVYFKTGRWRVNKILNN